MENSISSEKVTRMDGEMFTNQSKDPRYLEITGFIDTVAGRRQLEGELKRVFNTGVAQNLSKRFHFHMYTERLI